MFLLKLHPYFFVHARFNTRSWRRDLRLLALYVVARGVWWIYAKSLQSVPVLRGIGYGLETFCQ